MERDRNLIVAVAGTLLMYVIVIVAIVLAVWST